MIWSVPPTPLPQNAGLWPFSGAANLTGKNVVPLIWAGVDAQVRSHRRWSDLTTHSAGLGRGQSLEKAMLFALDELHHSSCCSAS